MELYELTVADAVRVMRNGDVSPVEFVQALLDRIAATEPLVQAWETIDADRALAAAKSMTAERKELAAQKQLFGLPVGVKDIFHARGLPTIASFAPYRGHLASGDSAVVERFREAGAIILGKTVTAQFAASLDAPKTCNPWNLEHTPGGSSTGSAASVAARQVPAAVGSQTGGSLLRPASYCGIVALKPTFGRISRYGMLPVSWTIDHAGIIVRSVADAALLLQALVGYDPRDAHSVKTEPEDFVEAVRESETAPRFGLVRDLLERADPAVREATEAAVMCLARAGAQIEEVNLPVSMDLLLAIQFLIMNSETAVIHADQYARLSKYYEEHLAANIQVTQLVPAVAYAQALRLRQRLQPEMAKMIGGLDGLIAPTALNLPPKASTGTGDPTFQSIWTMLGFPNITLPTGLSPERLPHGIQIIGRPFNERVLLRAAAWSERVLGSLPLPL